MSFNALLLPVHRKSDFGVTNKKHYGMLWLIFLEWSTCAFHRIVIYRGIALSTELLKNWDYDGKVISIVFVAHGVNS